MLWNQPPLLRYFYIKSISHVFERAPAIHTRLPGKMKVHIKDNLTIHFNTSGCPPHIVRRIHNDMFVQEQPPRIIIAKQVVGGVGEGTYIMFCHPQTGPALNLTLKGCCTPNVKLPCFVCYLKLSALYFFKR